MDNDREQAGMVQPFPPIQGGPGGQPGMQVDYQRQPMGQTPQPMGGQPPQAMMQPGGVQPGMQPGGYGGQVFQPQVQVPFPIPGEHMTQMVRGALRMQLMTRYCTYTRYTPTSEESSLLNVHYVKGWISLATEMIVPIAVWFKTAKPLTPDEVERMSGGDPTTAKRMETAYARGLGWRMPARFAGLVTAFLLTRTLSGVEDELFFERFLTMQSPMGDYARYLLNEGQRAAEFRMSTVPHPPFPAPQQPYYPASSA